MIILGRVLIPLSKYRQQPDFTLEKIGFQGAQKEVKETHSDYTWLCLNPIEKFQQQPDFTLEKIGCQ